MEKRNVLPSLKPQQAQPEIANISLQIPPCWRDRLRLWFYSFEAATRLQEGRSTDGTDGKRTAGKLVNFREEDVEKTAILTPMRLFRFPRICSDLNNAVWFGAAEFGLARPRGPGRGRGDFDVQFEDESQRIFLIRNHVCGWDCSKFLLNKSPCPVRDVTQWGAVTSPCEAAHPSNKVKQRSTHFIDPVSLFRWDALRLSARRAERRWAGVKPGCVARAASFC
ncbi:hypothetical protein EVAR_26431_1 [Eumeta japonica]|uniref:Uncharacterized protein n=1 Tax=Eumeta variegata TaxID=151549 RepID=A0A4C1VQY4_EUMVA|nr:hypothetical protein EVAR_26431_1 [Eumeta japonica]